VSGVVIRTGTAQNFNVSSKFREVAANCNTGEVVLGGGANVYHSSPSAGNNALVAEKVHISASYPSLATQWTVKLYSQDQTSNYLVQPYAVCAATSP
jgi:hypothetical protein